jgi:hypothetical protein
MTPGSRAMLSAAIDAALAREMPHALWVPGVTVLVVDDEQPEAAELALERMTRALDRAGIGARRRLVLVPARTGAPAPPGLLDRLARAAASPALAHDAVRSAGFSPGRDAGGVPLVVNDELREAELIVVLAPLRRGVLREDPLGVHARIHPGLAVVGPGTARPDPAAVRRLLPVDFAVLWRPQPGDSWQVEAGAPEALATRVRILDHPTGAG